jgi:hypothetical protein
MREFLQPLEATMNPLYTEDDLQFITRMWAGEIIWTLPGTRETAQALGEAEWVRGQGGVGGGGAEDSREGQSKESEEKQNQIEGREKEKKRSSTGVGVVGVGATLGGGGGGGVTLWGGGGKGGALRVGYLSSNLQGGAVFLMIQVH